ncbi:hypothetical protein Ciccas_000840 [Cichlidogyrus casuarinus]|uniref:Uncharacterized protein n=1 Tax=Cichlidogyrus casuarinus TaxID=1844966 RepID=A0ABD2QLS3_9PLAT
MTNRYNKQTAYYAHLLPDPPTLPLPDEPVFDPQELFNLTFRTSCHDNKRNGKFLKQSDSQVSFRIRNPDQKDFICFLRECAHTRGFTDVSELPALDYMARHLSRLSQRVKNFGIGLEELQLNLRMQQMEMSQKAAEQLVQMFKEGPAALIAETHAKELAIVRDAINDAVERKLGDKGKVERELRDNISLLEATLKSSQLEERARKSELARLKGENEALQLSLDLSQHALDRANSEARALLEKSSFKMPTPSSKTVSPDRPDMYSFGCQVGEDTAVEIEKLEHRLNENEKHLKQVNAALEASQNQCASLTKHCSLLQEEAKCKSEENGGLHSEIEVLRKELKSCKTANDHLQIELRGVEKRAQDAIESFKTARSNKELDIERAIEQQRRMVGEYESRLEAVAEERDQIRNQLLEKASENNELKAKVVHLHEAHKRELATLRAENKQGQEPPSTLREQVLVAEICRQRDELTRFKRAAERRLAAMSERLRMVSIEATNRDAAQRQASQVHKAAVAYADKMSAFNPGKLLPNKRASEANAKTPAIRPPTLRGTEGYVPMECQVPGPAQVGHK